MRLGMPRVALLLLVVGALAPLTYASESTFRARDPRAMYLALGDSLVTGDEEQAHNDNHPGYPRVMLKYLRAINPAIEVKTDLARDEETSTTITEAKPWASSQLTRARELIQSQRAVGRPVGLVTVGIGMRDMIEVIRSKGDANAARDTFKMQLGKVCDALLDALQNNFGVREGDLVLVSLYNPYPGLEFPNQGKIMDELVPLFNEAINEVAQSRNIPVADVASRFAGREAELVYVKRPYVDPGDILNPDLYADLDYHPRPAGHRVIAQSIMAAIDLRYMGYVPMVAK